MRKQREDAFRLVEDSAHLLRSLPADAWALYLVGAVPYGVGLMWFWLEMSRSFYALQNLAWSSALIAGLFLWKQVTEAWFMRRLRTALSGVAEDAPRPGAFRVLLSQAGVQPLSLVVLPLSLIATVPFAQAVFAFRQYSFDPSVSKAATTAGYDKQSSWTLLGVLTVAALILYLNLLATVLTVSQLASSFFGVSSLNTGLHALATSYAVHFAIAVTTYLCVDIVLDAAAALQSFHASSAKTGSDILAGLRRIAAAVVVLASSASAQDLDKAIDQTLQSREFAWREAAKGGEVNSFAKAVLDALSAVADKAGELFKALIDWLYPSGSGSPSTGAAASGMGLQTWLIILGVIALGAIAALLLHQRNKKAPAKKIAQAPVPVDLNDEATLASSRREDEWVLMAEELLSRGEFRLALRALHLACLRSLSERGLVSIARWKTGMDYLQEVRRRARGSDSLTTRVRQNVGLFEMGWYSHHAVDSVMVENYRAGLEEIRQHAR